MSKEIFTLFDIPIHCLTLEESVLSVFHAMQERSQRVFFATSYSLVKAHQDKQHKRALQLAEFCLQSGLGILLAARFLHNKNVPPPIEPEMWTYSFLDALQQRMHTPITLFCIGKEPSDLEALPSFIKNRWPNIHLSGAYTFSAANEEALLQQIEQKPPTILLLSLEIPEGERYIYQNWHRLKNAGIKVTLTGENILENMLGSLPRTTRLLRSLQIEKVLRAFCRPKFFIQRYVIGGICFAYLLLKTRWNR